MNKNKHLKYCNSYTSYQVNKTREINIGGLKLGGNNPIRLQSMSSCDPMDTTANVAQAIRIIEAGGELVRFTAPAVKDAENLKNIHSELRAKGYETPLVADIHFNPKAAMTAADYVEKVRINPGNYAEVSKSKINYSDDEYQSALNSIEVKFVELLQKCTANNVALRIGSNHGSLSQRIMDRFGDTPRGMVEAAMEYLRMAVKHDFYEIVISMKSSNIRVMVQAYRLLSAQMREENMNFPLHLGVTEAGDGEDGRIKSAAGIGALLEDGLGDTIRVSLTEDPELEIPVAKLISRRYQNRKAINAVNNIEELPYNPFEYSRRKSREISTVGANSEITVLTHDWEVDLCGAESESEAEEIFIFKDNDDLEDIQYLSLEEYIEEGCLPIPYFVEVCYNDFLNDSISRISPSAEVVLVFTEKGEYCVHKFRSMFITLMDRGLHFPVILKRNYNGLSEEELQINAAIDFGSLLVDGLGDGIWIQADLSQERINEISLGILQATRSRISKTDFISCPSCGRTLFNIQEATTIIREKTSHLKGLKIAIMGCIVNGPGEMADADYGYVGAGFEKINLYKGKEVIEKGIPEAEAVEALIELIKTHGDWVEES